MFNNLNSTLKKVLVVFLIITLTYANLVLIGTNIVQGLFSYALEESEESADANNEEMLDNEEEEDNLEDSSEEESILLSIENKDIHKSTIESGEVDYTENLNLNLSNRADISNITIEDVSNEFFYIEEQEDEEVVLQYKKTIINKENLLNLLGDEGRLVITDTVTDKVVTELTSEILKSQTIDESVEQKYAIEETSEEEITDEETVEEISEEEITDEEIVEEIRSNVTVTEETVVIEYVVEVTDIRFEFTNITMEQTENETENEEADSEEIAEDETTIEETTELILVIENIKNISNINDIDNLDYLEESIKYIIEEDAETTVDSTIKFKDTVTRASLSVDNTEWILGEANTVNYTITLDTTTEKSELFVNPMFLIELPTSVESINTANSEFTVNNDGGVFTGKKVFTTTVLGKKYVVITLTGEQTAESIQNGNTTINLSLELNVSADETEGNGITKIYYQNDTVTTYENGSSFDTDEVEISLILNNEEKEEIGEEIQDNIQEDMEEENLNVSLMVDSSAEEIIKQNEVIDYRISLYNYDLNEVENLVLMDVLPEGVTLEKVVKLVEDEENEIEYNYNEETRTISVNIDKLESATEEELQIEETGETGTYITAVPVIIKISVRTNGLEHGIYSKEINNIVKIQKEEKVLEEVTLKNIISDAFLDIQADELSEEMKENEEFIWNLKIENKGLLTSGEININIDIPEEISPRLYEEYVLSETGDQVYKIEGTLNTNKIEFNVEIQSKQVYYLMIVGTVGEIEDTKQVSIDTKVDNEEIITPIELVKDEETTGTEENPTQPSDPADPENPNNPNDPSDSTDPENPTNPNDPSDSTDPENPTNPNDPSNPTDPENPNVTTEGFDLSLTQYLNKVTVENAEGTTVYEYTDTNFAKVEIHSKYMNGSKVTLEYKIIVKNNGTIPGYARKIVNYKPEGLEFNQDLNKDWYVGDDGNIYSVALIEKLLNPGETAELTIILTKQMTNEDGGTIKNTVEIYEASNDENVEDVNSIPGDKLDGQNDMSTAQVIIAVKTGTIMLYITLATVVIAIIGLGFYKIKKVTLNKKGGC